MLAALLLLALAPPAVTAPISAPGPARAVDATGAEEERCPYMFDRSRMVELHASLVPRYVYYRVLEPGDGTRRSSLLARIVLAEDARHEATFEVVTRIGDGTTSYRVQMTRTLGRDGAGLELAEPPRIALTASRGEDEPPLSVPAVAVERDERGGWRYETATFEPDVTALVALVDASELAVSGPGTGWKPVLDDVDRGALRWFLWQHAPGGREALERSEERRAAAAATRPSGKGGAGGGDERDG